MNPVGLADPLTFSLVQPPGRHFWPLLEYLDIYWIALKLSTVVPCSYRISHTDFGDSPIFPVMPSAVQVFTCCAMSQHLPD